MQNHLEISSKTQFWTLNVRNWTQSRDLVMSGLAKTCPGGQVLTANQRKYFFQKLKITTPRTNKATSPETTTPRFKSTPAWRNARERLNIRKHTFGHVHFEVFESILLAMFTLKYSKAYLWQCLLWSTRKHTFGNVCFEVFESILLAMFTLKSRHSDSNWYLLATITWSWLSLYIAVGVLSAGA